MADDDATTDRKRPDVDGTMTNVDPLRPGDRIDDIAGEATFSIGQLIAGRYRVETYIARGGMGEVYQVLDEELDERVALKTILPRTAGDATAVDRFRREIQIARKVSHPNVCRIFDLGRDLDDDGRDVLFLTMELLQGRSLRARLQDDVMTSDEAFDVVEQLAAGLAAAHRLGIVHRDLKPSNIFLVPDGDRTRVVIADFGLARTEMHDGDHPTVTGTGEILGTPAYMSPEQLEGRPATAASDVYALGLIMYEMLTGVRAFEGDSAFQMALNKLREQPTSPSARTPGVPPLWDRTILRCLEKDPAERIADVSLIPVFLSGGRRLPVRLKAGALRRPLTWVVAAVVVVSVGLGVLVQLDLRPRVGPAPVVTADLELRRSVAVLGFQNTTGDAENAWISTALQEFLTTELAAGGALRAVPSQSVANARAELGIDQITTLAPETLNRLRELLASDLLLLGSFTVLGAGDGGTLRLDLRIQDITNNELIVVPRTAGPVDEFFDIANRAAAAVQARLGLDVTGRAAVAGALPSDPVAARLYAEGVERLRSFDADGARAKLEEAVRVDPESALIWLELANAWMQMGYGEEAVRAARQAREQSGELDRELRLRIEGQHHLLAGRDREAVETFRSLWLVYPDNLEYGVRLAEAQSYAGMADAALETVAELRRLPKPLSDDPRIDLAEAAAAEALGDHALQTEAAKRVVTASQDIGSRGLEAKGRLALGSALRQSGDLEAALDEIEAVRVIEEAAGNRAGAAQASYSVALIHASGGDLDNALAEIDVCLEAAQESGARGVEAAALNLLGSVRFSLGQLEEAQTAFSDALALEQDIGNLDGQVDALNNIAVVKMSSGDLAGAVTAFNDVRAKCREVASVDCEAVAVLNLARVYGARGDLDGARRSFEEAEGMIRNLGDRGLLAEALFGLGEVVLTQGDLRQARTRHEEALELNREVRPDNVALSEFALAGVTLSEAALGERSWEDAAAGLSRAVAALAEQQRPGLEADALNYLAEAQLGAGRLEAAAATLDRVRSLDPVEGSVTAMVLRINQARLAGRRGQYRDAQRLLDGVMADAEAQSNLGVELEVRLVRGELLGSEGRTGEARRMLQVLRQDATARGWILVADKATEVDRRLGGEEN